MSFDPLRKVISKNRRRYQDSINGFDLDLTHITDSIIAHSFPAKGFEIMYRNPRVEIARYLELNYPDQYYMYNFCNEKGRGYNKNEFSGRVKRYPMHDHCCPPLQLMVDFANAAKTWLDRVQGNVCSLHCIAGRGRTGLMACVLLIRTGVCATPEAAISLFNSRRTADGCDDVFTRVSQALYVHFYARLWREVWNISGNIGDEPVRDLVLPTQPLLSLRCIRLTNVSERFTGRLVAKIYKCSQAAPKLTHVYEAVQQNSGTIEWVGSCVLSPDFIVVVEERFLGLKKTLLSFWYNTYFLSMENRVEGYGWKDFNRAHSKANSLLGESIRMQLDYNIKNSSI